MQYTVIESVAIVHVARQVVLTRIIGDFPGIARITIIKWKVYYASPDW